MSVSKQADLPRLRFFLSNRISENFNRISNTRGLLKRLSIVQIKSPNVLKSLLPGHQRVEKATESCMHADGHHLAYSTCCELWLKLYKSQTDGKGIVQTCMLLTVIRVIISFSSPTHSFIPGLKPSFSPYPSHCSLSFFLQDWLHDSPDFYCYFWAYPFLLFSFSVLHFLVVVSVRYLKLTHLGFPADVKIASSIV